MVTINLAPPVSRISNYYFEMVGFKLSQIEEYQTFLSITEVINNFAFDFDFRNGRGRERGRKCASKWIYLF